MYTKEWPKYVVSFDGVVRTDIYPPYKPFGHQGHCHSSLRLFLCISPSSLLWLHYRFCSHVRGARTASDAAFLTFSKATFSVVRYLEIHFFVLC